MQPRFFHAFIIPPEVIFGIFWAMLETVTWDPLVELTWNDPRGHDFTLVKGQSKFDVRMYSFSQRTVNEWNKLSADCVHSSSINMF